MVTNISQRPARPDTGELVEQAQGMPISAMGNMILNLDDASVTIGGDLTAELDNDIIQLLLWDPKSENAFRGIYVGKQEWDWDPDSEKGNVDTFHVFMRSVSGLESSVLVRNWAAVERRMEKVEPGTEVVVIHAGYYETDFGNDGHRIMILRPKG